MNKNIIKKHLTETFLSEDKKPDSLSSTEKIQSDSKKINSDNQNEVAKKMKSYEEPIEAETEPVKYKNNEDQQEYHDEMEIMNGLEMNRFDNEPAKQFKERAEEAISGSARMGNSPEWANVITADQAGFTGPEFGKNLVKKIKSSKEKRDTAEANRNHNKTSVSGTDFKDSAMGNKNPKSMAISENKKINEGLTEKGLLTLGNWVKELGADKAAVKLIDKVSETGIVSSFPDSMEYGEGLNIVSKHLANGKYDAAYKKAKSLANKLEKKGMGGMFENVNEGRPFQLGKGYTHFAIFKLDGKIATGWDYKSLYDKHEKAYDDESIKEYARHDIVDDFPDNKLSDFKIVTRGYLEKKNIDISDSNNWFKPNINKDDNTIEINESMKRLVFKKEFKGVENALRLIPESYKVNNKQFQMTDGNEKYEIRWEGNLTEGRAIITKASDKNLMTEDMQKMKHLMGYKSQDTLGIMKGQNRIDENKAFGKIWDKTKNLLNEQIEIDSTSDLYSKFGEDYPYASDAVAKFIFGYNEIDNEIVNAIKNNKLDEYELSEFMLDYEYSWEENMETINDYVKNLINNN
jgi:hypothetical protein